MDNKELFTVDTDGGNYGRIDSPIYKAGNGYLLGLKNTDLKFLYFYCTR